MVLTNQIRGVSSPYSTVLERLQWNETTRGRSFHLELFVSISNFQANEQPTRTEIAQLTFAAGSRRSTRKQGCRHVGSECT